MSDASPTTRPPAPIFNWQAWVLDVLQVVVDWMLAEMDRPIPPAGALEVMIPEPDLPALGLRFHGRYLVLAPDGYGCWLAPWVLGTIEVCWNAPQYTLTALGGAAVVAAAPMLPASEIGLGVWFVVVACGLCLWGVWLCCREIAGRLGKADPLEVDGPWL